MSNIHTDTTVVPWQDAWESIFKKEKESIISSNPYCELYHVGSTSVKGMCAKPIIDILMCPKSNENLEAYFGPLEKLGYLNLGECGRRERYFLTKGNKENETFYLHLCHTTHQVAKDQKLFRFILQNDHTVFNEYMYLKKHLMHLCKGDRDMYRIIKGRFINGVISAYRMASGNSLRHVSLV